MSEIKPRKQLGVWEEKKWADRSRKKTLLVAFFSVSLFHSFVSTGFSECALFTAVCLTDRSLALCKSNVSSEISSENDPATKEMCCARHVRSIDLSVWTRSPEKILRQYLSFSPRMCCGKVRWLYDRYGLLNRVKQRSKRIEKLGVYALCDRHHHLSSPVNVYRVCSVFFPLSVPSFHLSFTFFLLFSFFSFSSSTLLFSFSPLSAIWNARDFEKIIGSFSVKVKNTSRKSRMIPWITIGWCFRICSRWQRSNERKFDHRYTIKDKIREAQWMIINHWKQQWRWSVEFQARLQLNIAFRSVDMQMMLIAGLMMSQLSSDQLRRAVFVDNVEWPTRMANIRQLVEMMLKAKTDNSSNGSFRGGRDNERFDRRTKTSASLRDWLNIFFQIRASPRQGDSWCSFTRWKSLLISSSDLICFLCLERECNGWISFLCLQIKEIHSISLKKFYVLNFHYLIRRFWELFGSVASPLDGISRKVRRRRTINEEGSALFGWEHRLRFPSSKNSWL